MTNMLEVVETSMNPKWHRPHFLQTPTKAEGREKDQSNQMVNVNINKGIAQYFITNVNILVTPRARWPFVCMPAHQLKRKHALTSLSNRITSINFSYSDSIESRVESCK